MELVKCELNINKRFLFFLILDQSRCDKQRAKVVINNLNIVQSSFLQNTIATNTPPSIEFKQPSYLFIHFKTTYLSSTARQRSFLSFTKFSHLLIQPLQRLWKKPHFSLSLYVAILNIKGMINDYHLEISSNNLD